MDDVNKRRIQKGSYYKLLLPYIIICLTDWHLNFLWRIENWRSINSILVKLTQLYPTGCGLYFLMASTHIHLTLLHAWRRQLLPPSFKKKKRQVDSIEGAPGFKPGTVRSAVGCSTTELYPCLLGMTQSLCMAFILLFIFGPTWKRRVSRLAQVQIWTRNFPYSQWSVQVIKFVRNV